MLEKHSLVDHLEFQLLVIIKSIQLSKFTNFFIACPWKLQIKTSFQSYSLLKNQKRCSEKEKYCPIVKDRPTLYINKKSSWFGCDYVRSPVVRDCGMFRVSRCRSVLPPTRQGQIVLLTVYRKRGGVWVITSSYCVNKFSRLIRTHQITHSKSKSPNANKILIATIIFLKYCLKTHIVING